MRHAVVLSALAVAALVTACSDPGTGVTPPASDGGTTDPDAAIECGPGLTACGSTCVDLTSPDHCGGCNVVCPPGPNGAARSCTNGTCGSGCGKGTRLCASKNACEKESASSCGAACVVCPSPTNGYGLCDKSVCTTECNSGYGACPTGCCATKIVDIALGEGHACTLDVLGHVKCWGNDLNGQTGDSATFFASGPVHVTASPFLVNLPPAKAIAAAGDRTCAILVTGEMKCWGYSGDGGLGDPSAFNTATPVQVKGMTNVSAIGLGNFHTCAVQAGQVYCWGSSDYGELGIGGALKNKVTSPTLVPGITNAIAVAAAYWHTCALTATGTVKCWGRKALLGSVAANDATTPVDVPSLTGITAISSTRSHACALTSTGGVKCWGFGYLGNGGSALGGTAPVDVTLPSPAIGLRTGYRQTCAILQGGAMWCWGENSYGELGDGTTTTRPTPVANGLTSIAAIATGTFVSCAVATDGTTRCWGSKGDVTRASANVLTPAIVLGLP